MEKGEEPSRPSNLSIKSFCYNMMNVSEGNGGWGWVVRVCAHLGVKVRTVEKRMRTPMKDNNIMQKLFEVPGKAGKVLPIWRFWTSNFAQCTILKLYLFTQEINLGGLGEVLRDEGRGGLRRTVRW